MEPFTLFAHIPVLTTASIIDLVIFIGFIITVVAVGIGMSRGSKGSESYFLAGRGLGWWLIGFSLIAANISTEQFVGMSGSAADYVGLAIASYEWMAAVTLIIVGFIFLPHFLKAGIYTIPEFLEKRYNRFSRTFMSLIMMITFVTVNTTAVIYSGAKVYSTFFDSQTYFGIPLDIVTFSWLIGILAATYVFFGGLKACAWADLLQGSALIIGGTIVLVFALNALGNADVKKIDNAVQTAAVQSGTVIPENDVATIKETSSGSKRFSILNAHKLRMNLPWNDGVLPITALLLGLWIPNLYYWGLNQYIMQRTLGSRSLAEGQKGIVFAAFMKLIVPFIVVFPGLIAFNLFSSDMRVSASSRENNGVVLEKFESVKNDPTGQQLPPPKNVQFWFFWVKTDPNSQRSVFPFDKDFAKIEQEKATEIVLYNAAVAEIKTDVSKQKLLEQNKQILAEIAKKNATLPKENKIIVEKELMGYDYDAAFPLLMSKLVPGGGFRGFMLAAMLGAVISSLASMLNAASTIFTMDLYKEYLHRQAGDKTLVFVGRFCVVLFTITSCLIAPMLNRPELGGVFHFIQEFQGFISPGILAVFLFGFASKRAPAICGPTALISSPIIYALLKFFLLPDVAFLDRMAITFASVLIVLTIFRITMPRSTPYEPVSKTTIEMQTSRGALVGGFLVLIITAILYFYFWDYETPVFKGFLDSLLIPFRK
ncbi:MAG: sodium/solute symporter [Planctomycetaceae bacterium]|jgi:SSS family solute:Na+ symporter|nr:sodium/solute symporter [Planctomycetaceae bacterium]